VVDRRLVAAVAAQLGHRDAALRRGAERMGWKLGVGARERIGGEIAVGHLTSETVLAPGATFAAGPADLHADVELAVVVGAGYAVALELVDLASPPDDPQAIVAANVFHRAVTFGPLHRDRPDDVEAMLVADGGVRATGRADSDPEARIAAAARVLEACGERLLDGDRVITGSILQAPVARGEELVARIRGLGEVSLRVA
jgi:hypothetical protein